MKKTLLTVLIVVIALLGLGIVRDQIIKSAITVVASKITGAPVHIDGFSLGIFNQRVRISGFKMYNPKGFAEGILVSIDKIDVTYDLGALLKRKIHLVNAEIELNEMGLQKNKEGKLNVDSLKVVKENQGAKPQEQMPLGIDILKLGIGKVVLKDYSVAKEPSVSVYDVNIHKTYKNISSAQQLAALIMSEPMKAAGIQGAKIYGVAMLGGVAILPVAVAATFIGRDSVEKEFNSGADIVYQVSLEILGKMGKVTKENKAGSAINADVNGAQVSLKIDKKSGNKSKMTISARKYFLPKPEIAAGILYEISEKIK